MIERLAMWLREQRIRETARSALCDHDGSEPMCGRCASFYNGA